jgi:hypothetical protein
VTLVRFCDYLKIQSVVPVSGRRNDSSSNMKKYKILKKRIRRLEARLQKGGKKLAKLKQKLEAAETGAAAEPKGKSAALAKKAGKASASGQHLALKADVKPAAAEKVKRKLNLTPERRAQLAETMRARWAAKRAAAATSTQNSSSAQGSS